MDSKPYVAYNPDDFVNFGAQDIIADELVYISRRRKHGHGGRGKEPEDRRTKTGAGTDGRENDETRYDMQDFADLSLTGLALSGGGIRSASFCLGVMQALAYNRWLDRFDYLSTVSGGGYIGSSVSWLLSQKLEKDTLVHQISLSCSWSILPQKSSGPGELKEGLPSFKKNLLALKRFGMERSNFPYGTYPMVGADPTAGSGAEKDEETNTGGITPVHRGKLLRYLRQHAKYLTPGDGLNIMSLVSVMLRGAMLSLIVYFGMLLMAFLPLHYLLDVTYLNINPVQWAALLFVVVYAVLVVFYPVFTYYYSGKETISTVDTGQQGVESESHPTDRNVEIADKEKTDRLKRREKAYCLRKSYEKFTGWLLTMILALVVLGLIPDVYQGLEKLTSSVCQKNAPEICNMGSFSGLSALFGLLSGVLAFFKTGSGKKGRIPMGWLVAVGTAALVFGLLLLAYHISGLLTTKFDWKPVTAFFALAVVVWVIGRFANINYISIHRFYRDRLMEAFMPDIDKVMDGKVSTRAAAGANSKPLFSLIGDAETSDPDEYRAPYHLINCNVVLDSSPKPKFRGRGGDSFILSPKYCGSNATGWAPTENFMNGHMNLPTAMAISGAAVNPGTGVGGEGVTRQPLLSMLMGLLNIRLGYWAANPFNMKNKKYDNKAVVIPNFISPGLCDLFLRSRLHEEAKFVQLTDGGHFENLALYELIRRRARLIVVCDAGADPKFDFNDLSNAIEKARVDFGTLILLDYEDLKVLVPKSSRTKGALKCARQGYLIGDILYPDSSKGRLIYLKTTFFKKLSADIYGYKMAHPEFPDESTGDQFFDEKQFEAYRELGFQTAWEMMKDKTVCDDEYVKPLMEI